MKWLRILSLKFYHKLLGIMNVRELTQNELNRISQAFVFAFSAHSGTSRGDGVPYVIHPTTLLKIIELYFLRLKGNFILKKFLFPIQNVNSAGSH